MNCKQGIKNLEKDTSALIAYSWLLKNRDSEIYTITVKHLFAMNRLHKNTQKSVDSLINKLHTKDFKQYSFGELLMHIDNKNYQFSFASKLMHMTNNSLPIYDSHIADSIGWHFQNKKSKLKNCNTTKERVNELNRLWDKFQKTWNEYTQKDAKHCCELFDKAFPKYKNISRTKKIDFMLWASKKA